jgi:Leucine-rich repeat (LRR) protein
MESSATTLSHTAQLAKASFWWSTLTDAWKQAFNEVAFQRSTTEDLPEEMLLRVYQAPNHRFSGPTAPYPNMSTELSDLSGLVGLPNATVVVVTFHQLTHIREVAGMHQLRSLFIYNNQITSLEGIEGLTDLEELYFQSNRITTLEPLTNLVRLKALYCPDNLIADLNGLGVQHADTLENFICQPNPNLKQTTVVAFEHATHIRCKKG